MKVRRLKNLRVKRVDLVERGANQESHVVLFKSEELMVECSRCGVEFEKANPYHAADGKFTTGGGGGGAAGGGAGSERRSNFHSPELGGNVLVSSKNVEITYGMGAMKPALRQKVRQKKKENWRVEVFSGGGEIAGTAIFTPPKGVSPRAFFKSAEELCAACAEKEMKMDEQEIEKIKADADAMVAKAESQREAFEKTLKEQSEVITKLQARLDESDARAKKAEQEVQLASFKKTVEEFEHLPVKIDTFAPILHKCNASLEKTEFDELMRVLKAADAASGENFVEHGAPGHGTNARSAAEELDVKAQELVSKSKLSPAEALVEVSRQNPKLADRARRESYAKREN